MTANGRPAARLPCLCLALAASLPAGLAASRKPRDTPLVRHYAALLSAGQTATFISRLVAAASSCPCRTASTGLPSRRPRSSAPTRAPSSAPCSRGSLSVGVCSWERPSPMPSRLHDHEGAEQGVLAVSVQHTLQLRVYGSDGGWCHPQIDNPCSQTLHDDQIAEVCLEQLQVIRSSQPQFLGGHHVMAQPAQKLRRDRVHILVCEEPHSVGARSMSSSVTTSMAY